MSGGSYDYLCFADSTEITQRVEQLERMRDRLAELGHHTASQRTQDVITHIEALYTLADQMRGVWHAVEWVDSGDWRLDDLEPVVRKWEQELKP